MIARSLNLVGDEGLEDLIEAAFGLRFTDAELASMNSVGAIHDVISAKLPEREGSCATSKVFFRLRRELMRQGMARATGPGTLLSNEVLARPNATLRSLSRATGLRLPPNETGPLMTGGLLSILAATLSFMASLVLQQQAFAWLAAFAMAAGLVLAKLDRGRLPPGVKTVGDLARQAAILNFGRLAAEGGRVTKDLSWAVLCQVLGEALDLDPRVIGRDTLIYPAEKAAA